METRNAVTSARTGTTRYAFAGGPRFALSPLAAAVASLATALSPIAHADVSSTGDVSPAFAPAPVVNLPGQSVYIGSTVAGVGQVGTLSVTAGGVLTAAQIVPGIGGLGIGFVNVTGAGSRINLTGGGTFNGLDVGSWGTGTVTVSNGGSIACATVAACTFNSVGNAAGSTGTLVINGGSVTGLGQLAIAPGNLSPGFGSPGANTTGTLTISNGGTLSTNGFASIAANTGLAGNVSGSASIDGVGSSWTITRDFPSGTGQASLVVGRNANSNGSLTVSNGGALTIVGQRSAPASDNSLPALQIGLNAGASGTVTVTSGGSIRLSGDSGVLNVGGNNASTGGTGTLNITGGGTVAGTGANGLTFVGVGRLGGGTGTINISGAGSQLAVAGVGGQNTQNLDGVGGLVVIGGTGGNSGTLNVTNGGALLISDNGQVTTNGGPGLRLGDGTSTATATISGAGSSVVVSSTSGSTATTPYVRIGNGGAAQMTIKDGATVSLLGSGQREFVVGFAAGGTGALSMTNGASIVASRFAVADNGGVSVATLDNSSIHLDGVINFNGFIGAGVRVGRGDGADGTLNLQNGSTIRINNSVDSASVILGGTGSLAAGTGHLNMSGGSSIAFTGPAANASLQVGGTSGTGFMAMTGASSVDLGATGTVSVGSQAAIAGTLSVASGSSITANVINIGGNSDTVTGGVGSATVTGAGSALVVGGGGTGLLAVGRNGTGSLTVNDQGSISALALSVGRNANGNGTFALDHGTVSLTGQQTVATNLSGANLSIGIANGVGAATITNGSTVTIANAGSLGAALNVGGRPDIPGAGGTGVLTVSNSQINITAAPGLATARIGYDGTGIATLTNSRLNVGNATESGADGSLLIGARPGSTGVLTLNAGSVVNAGYVGVGASPAGPGGSGTLFLNNSVLNADTFELGAGGVLAGTNGRLHVANNVIVGGTISPGNSPAALLIDCNIITLAGSMLILDILSAGEGFDIDHLRIGNNSTFDLRSVHVLLNFLDNTDPNSFVASGGLDLDNFLQSYDLADGSISGLSTVFAAGQSWLNVIDPANITAASPIYDVSGIHLGADGTIELVAVPVPEPATWGLFAAGLAAMAALARRRRAALARA
jgi:hypothetical protein